MDERVWRRDTAAIRLAASLNVTLARDIYRNPQCSMAAIFYSFILKGFLQTAASPTPGQARGKSRNAIPTQGNYGLLDISEFFLFLKL